jgi:cellulose synthase/poly-beta-1,6-N-acetylglucosamine synthase-like glycosyltransferase
VIDSPLTKHARLHAALEVVPVAQRDAGSGGACSSLALELISPVLAISSLHAAGRRLGDLLISSGSATAGAVEAALDEQQRTGVSLGEALVSLGYARADRVAHALAAQYDLDVLTTLESSGESPSCCTADDTWYQTRRLVPLSVRNGVLRLATTDPTNTALMAEAARVAGMPVQPVVATNRDIERALNSLCALPDLYQSTNGLLERMPEDSAYRVLSREQKTFLLACLVACLAALLIDTTATLVVLITLLTVLHLASCAYKLYLLHQGADAGETVFSSPETAHLDDRALPVYSILVPLYREAVMLPQLLKALQALDWPKAKLDVRLLLEQDDVDTINAARAARLPAYFTFVIVPAGLPRGKPKACNFGLAHARGEYVVIFDAEDIPEPDQLKKVYAAFQSVGADLGCIQCHLNFYNADQNLLTRWFTAEYSVWFDILLPSVQAARVPVPLGGTSNHFRRDVLEQLGAWDPYNVTEDADLGVRLFKRGLRTAVLTSTTYEEANPQLGNWLRQRSRWIKGYLQTWLVHMRHPLVLWRELGPGGFVGFQLLLGGTVLVLLLNPLFWALVPLWFATRSALLQQLFPGPVFYLGATALYVGNILFIYLAMAGSLGRGYHALTKYALLSPVYWVLMSVAAWKGTLQLIRRPHYWEKTVHGLARFAVVPAAPPPDATVIHKGPGTS